MRGTWEVESFTADDPMTEGQLAGLLAELTDQWVKHDSCELYVCHAYEETCPKGGDNDDVTVHPGSWDGDLVCMLQPTGEVGCIDCESVECYRVMERREFDGNLWDFASG